MQFPLCQSIDGFPNIRYKPTMKQRLLFLALVVSLVLSACGGQPAPDAIPGQTALPSLTPSPTVTPTPSPENRISLAERSLFLGDFEAASVELQTVLATSGDPEVLAHATLELGRIAYLRKDYPACITTLSTLYANWPETQASINAAFYLGECYFQSDQPAQAAEWFTRYTKTAPDWTDGFVLDRLGDAFSRAGDHPAAIQAFESTLATGYFADPAYLHLSIGKEYAAQGDHSSAVRSYLTAYDSTNNEYARSQANLLLGQSYLALGEPGQAYARYQDSVNNYPRPFDSYTQLVALVTDGQAVSEFQRGLVDYYAGQYSVGVEAFDRFMAANPEHDGAAHYYKALCLRALSQPDPAVSELNQLIRDHAGDPLWAKAWDLKADILWRDLENFDQAAQTLLDFAAAAPAAPETPDAIFTAGRIYEIGTRLSNAAATWSRLIEEYPSAERSYLALFLTGITYYRLGDYDQAVLTFQRNLALSQAPEDQAQAYFWIGKALKAKNDPTAAERAWMQAYQADPTEYYGERARQLIAGEPILNPPTPYDLGYDLAAERPEAEAWMRTTFNLPANTDFSGPGELTADANFQRGNQFWQLSQYTAARAEFETVRQRVSSDPVATFRLMNHLLELGMYRPAILSARQILDLAFLDDAATLTAPKYFNHIRFGVYFRELVLPEAQAMNIHPFVLLSLIRQESAFEATIVSGSGAVGLMQLLPGTGTEMANSLGWPAGFSANDLYRPIVNVRLGSRYLKRQLDYFGDLYAALSAYNGGPGNTIFWQALSPTDPDLFVELIRFEETRHYIRQIVEYVNLYRLIYQRLN